MEPAKVLDTEAPPVALAQPQGRVAALDLLRGICAISVAAYHGLQWVGIASLHNLGLYGVYMFFLLSGASMSLAYARRLRRGYPVTKYLLLRYVRLAPLYVGVAVYAALTYGLLHFTPISVFGRWLLNISFLFGFTNPGQISLVTGGWSLGIEFIFYFVFPLLLVLLGSRRAPLLVAAALAAQLVFINIVLAGTTLEAAWFAYTQFGAFVGYFAFGTWIGLRFAEGRSAPSRRQPLTWAGWLALVAILGTQSGVTAEGSLVGVRGLSLSLACCALLTLTMQLECPGPLRRIARWLGEASYPMYLIHPIVYFRLGDLRLLAAFRQQRPGAFVALVLVVSFGLATIIYRAFEEPILKWGKRRIG
jgi:exopolysaccharide production protein ExoZ